MVFCSHCGGPIVGTGHIGRPWPGRAAQHYCCYGCLSLGEETQNLSTLSPAAATPGRSDTIGLRLGIGILVVSQSMIFGLALNLHEDVPHTVRRLTQTGILFATLLVVVLLGPPLFRAAWQELRRGRLTIEALFLLTMAGAMTASLQAHFSGHGKIYFEVVSILLVVYTLGKLIGARSRAAAMTGTRAWAGQLETCRLVDDRGRMRTIGVREVLPGDFVQVNPGETFAVDGVIREGVGFVSEAVISGEPFAVVRRPGDRVTAGAASHDAVFRIEATAAGTDRQIDRLLAAVESARDRPASFQARADALGRWFFPLVVFTAFGTFSYWTFAEGNWESGLFNAMSVLLVACPCVIGLATPIVIWSALGRLAERGVIVRAGDAVERLAAVDRVMLDKTGTMTDENFAILDIATVAEGQERARLLGLLSLVQERSNHPVARPFARLPRPFPPEAEPRVRSLRFVPGCGVEAEVEENGSRHGLRIGTPCWIESGLVPRDRERLHSSHHASVDPASQLRSSGHRVDVSLDGELVASAVLAERLRESAPQALEHFRRLRLPVEVLTGDSSARSVGLSIPVRAGLLPDEKRVAVEAVVRSGGRPLFVGDGINDAGALATAHVGVALASGTDLAVVAADVTLYHNDLRVLPWAVELSREAVLLVKRNLARAVGYNLVGMALAASGVLHPVVAALLMVASSLSLMFSSTRVGVYVDHCSEDPSADTIPENIPEARRAAVIHGTAFVLQGVVLLFLLTSLRGWPMSLLLLGGFTFTGVGLAVGWNRWGRIPHTLDMCFGMLTLGNLGMLLGWWADNGFVSLRDGGCSCCVEAMRGEMLGSPWMWVGMLVFANLAMAWFPRRSASHGRDHALAMYSGGNAGMVLGMLAGGRLAGLVEVESVTAGALTGFVGMTLGMLVGMLLGTWTTEKLLVAARSLRFMPRWLRIGLRHTAG